MLIDNKQDRYPEGAKVAYETIQQWAKRNDKFLSLIVVVDIYGDYSKVINDNNRNYVSARRL